MRVSSEIVTHRRDSFITGCLCYIQCFLSSLTEPGDACHLLLLDRILSSGKESHNPGNDHLAGLGPELFSKLLGRPVESVS